MNPIRTCPLCKLGTLVYRKARKTGHLFWGCSRWPRCDHTERIREYDRMKAMGAPELPLFDASEV